MFNKINNSNYFKHKKKLKHKISNSNKTIKNVQKNSKFIIISKIILIKNFKNKKLICKNRKKINKIDFISNNK